MRSPRAILPLACGLLLACSSAAVQREPEPGSDAWCEKYPPQVGMGAAPPSLGGTITYRAKSASTPALERTVTDVTCGWERGEGVTITGDPVRGRLRVMG